MKMPGTDMTMAEWYDKANHCAAWLYIHGIVPGSAHDRNRDRIVKLFRAAEAKAAKPSRSQLPTTLKRKDPK
jgi:hypothetical protein